jgi:glyoxylase-like metal-dependent hydrolase (beta-lactamase superfamily II)
VLLKITPNIDLWPESLPYSLARYLNSLSGMRGMNANVVLPGHGPIFYDLGGRIDELLLHHEERLEVMYTEIKAGPRTPFEVSSAPSPPTSASSRRRRSPSPDRQPCKRCARSSKEQEG